MVHHRGISHKGRDSAYVEDEQRANELEARLRCKGALVVLEIDAAPACRRHAMKVRHRTVRGVRAASVRRGRPRWHLANSARRAERIPRSCNSAASFHFRSQTCSCAGTTAGALLRPPARRSSATLEVAPDDVGTLQLCAAVSGCGQPASPPCSARGVHVVRMACSHKHTGYWRAASAFRRAALRRARVSRALDSMLLLSACAPAGASEEAASIR